MRNYHVSYCYQHGDSWDYGFGHTDLRCEYMNRKTIESLLAKLKQIHKGEAVILLGINRMDDDVDPMEVQLAQPVGSIILPEQVK